MISAPCASCQRVTGHKRALGWGTFFACVATVGLWMVTLPFYAKRCMICGTMAPKTAASYRRLKRLLVGLVGFLVLMWLVGMLSSGRWWSSPAPPVRPVDPTKASYPPPECRKPGDTWTGETCVRK